MLLARPTGLILVISALGFTTATACAPAKAPSRSVLRSNVLPLRTVRLYETGVGYFERQGDLGSPSGVSLPVPSGHLDDALKTLIVITDQGKARVNGFEFASRITPGLARKLAGLPSVADEPITYRALLASLAGAHVAVKVRRTDHGGELDPSEGRGEQAGG